MNFIKRFILNLAFVKNEIVIPEDLIGLTQRKRISVLQDAYILKSIKYDKAIDELLEIKLQSSRYFEEIIELKKSLFEITIKK